MSAEVYTRNPCPYCVNAKKLLDAKGIEYTEIPVTVENKPDLLARVKAATISEEHPEGLAPTSVPQIFVDGEYVGGYDQLVLYFKRVAAENDDGA